MSPRASLVSVHVAVLLFGFAGLFARWIDWTPSAIVLGRTVVAALALAGVMRYRRAQPGRPSFGLLVNGALLALHWIAFFAAIKLSTVAIGLLGYASFPLFVLILERWLLGRTWRAGDALTAALVVTGLVSLVPQWSWSSGAVRGLAWAILSGFTFALLTVRTRALRADRDAPSLAVWQNTFAALCLLPVVAWQGGAGGAITAEALGRVAVLGVLCTALAHVLFIASLKELTAHTASVVAALEPVYGILLALLLLGEFPDGRTWIGAVLLMAAAVIASRQAPEPPAA